MDAGRGGIWNCHADTRTPFAVAGGTEPHSHGWKSAAGKRDVEPGVTEWALRKGR